MSHSTEISKNTIGSIENMNNIIFHSNILSKEDIPFLNQVWEELNSKEFNFILTGWNSIPKEASLKPKYYKLPANIHCIKKYSNISHLISELKSFGLDIDDLLIRFEWWFPKSKTKRQRKERIAFLHFHLHHYIKLVKKYNPGIVLIWNGNDPRHIIFKTVANYFGLATYFLERGPLPSVIFYDHSGVLSHSSVKFLKNREFGDFNNEIKLLNNYKDWYFSSNETLWEQPEASKVDIRQRYGIPLSKKITLFIGQVDNDIQTKIFSPNFQSNLEAFRFFLENCREENHFVVAKHHPKNNQSIEFFRRESANYNNVVWTDEFPLDECLNQVDNVVAVNSSVIFDALLYKKPVFSLGTTMLDGKDILYEFNPNNLSCTLNKFYSQTDLKSRLNNFNRLLSYMFKNNLLFTKDNYYSSQFSELLQSEFKSHHNIDAIEKHVRILESYYAYINSKQKKDNTFLIRIFRRLKGFLKLYI